MLANWKLWPAFQVFNLNFVPVHYQVVTVNIVSIFWNTYLSIVQYADKKETEES
jgi:hypothetical protein